MPHGVRFRSVLVVQDPASSLRVFCLQVSRDVHSYDSGKANDVLQVCEDLELIASVLDCLC